MDINELTDVLGENKTLDPLMEAITQIMNFDERLLTPQVAENLRDTISSMYSPELIETSKKELITSLEARGLTKAGAHEFFDNLEHDVQDVFDTLQPSANKSTLLHAIFDPITEMFKEVIEHYHTYDFELPIALEKEAHVPTYAHDTDTGADLYAVETVVVPARSVGNKIKTGVRIALPENWTAYIMPRSSIGAKTPLRLSNSVGVIDSDYRGELGILYDNISDSDYTINAGDRIAQLIIMPAYHFKPQVVDILPTTERNEGGFGSSGK